MVELVGSRGEDWHLLTAGAFVTMVVPLLVFLGPQRFLRPGTSGRICEGMTSSVADPHLMVAFTGTDVPDEIARELWEHPVAGVSLFRFGNVDDPEQVRRLTTDLQALNRSDVPLLIAGDQETGQLQGLGATDFPGNMALGAAADPELTRRVGLAIAFELRAMGVNVDYAPVCDVVTIADNPSLGVRSFGDRPAEVAALAAAMTRGLLDGGVVPVLKHFPGKGDAAIDPHHAMPVLHHDRQRLDTVEFPPFRAGIDAGASMVMIGHYGLPAITGDAALPASLSPDVIGGLLRRGMGFDGVVITDALDMGGITGGGKNEPAVVDALGAGTDLLLCTPAMASRDRIRAAIEVAVTDGRLDPNLLHHSRARITALRRSMRRHAQPALETVGSLQHRRLSVEVARRSVTIVRDHHGRIPLSVGAGDRVLAVMPEPADLTPADTSSLVPPGLATAMRRHHRAVTELVVDRNPEPSDIAAIVSRALDHDVLIVGTINATTGQAGLVSALIRTGRPVITLALRDPFDLRLYPEADVHLATYSIHRESIDAAADVLFGVRKASGALPVTIPGFDPVLGVGT